MASHASQCFPARNLLRFKKNSGSDGAWLVAYKEEQKRRFNAVLCPDKLKDNVQQSRNRGSSKTLSYGRKNKQTELSGIYLMKELKVDDPSDIASINIIAKDLVSAKHEDFVLFDNVEHIEAGENQLTMESFKTFPVLRELELQLNNISCISISGNDYPYLEMLDLSYNNIREEDVLALGILPVLKCLLLTGNSLKHLPVLKPRYSPESQDSMQGISDRKPLFESLKILSLDENEFEDNLIFASLASLPRLKILNLSKNYLRSVPLLHPANSKTHSNSPVDDYRDDNLLTNFHHPETEPALQVDKSDPTLAQEHDADLSEFTLGAIDRLDLNIYNSNEQTDEEEMQNNSGLYNNKSLDFDLPQDHSQYPFLRLEKLDISDNAVEEEDALLPLAGWPSLIEVNIWDNPLTRNCKGPPPLLQYHLSKLCGIELNRKKKKKIKKPAVGPVIAPAVKYNKVTEMPSIKRSNMLMLEFESYEAALQNGSLYKKPLPSIIPSGTDGDRHNVRHTHSAPANSNLNDLETSNDLMRPYSVAQDQFFPTESRDGIMGEPQTDKLDAKSKTVQDKTDGVFLTQVDGVEDENEFVEETSEENAEKDDETTKRPFKKTSLSENKDSKYEELLQIEGSANDIETPPADDLRGNIKALQHALNHALVFNEPSTAEWERQIYTQHKETRTPYSKSQKRGDKVKAVINQMKEQSNIVEENLDVVLERYDTDPQIRKQFPEVKKLLNEVQSKYNNVRLRSLETASNAQKLLKTSSKPVKNNINGRSINVKKLQKGQTSRLQREDSPLSDKKKQSLTQQSDTDNDVNKVISQFKASVEKRI